MRKRRDAFTVVLEQPESGIDEERQRMALAALVDERELLDFFERRAESESGPGDPAKDLT